MLFSDTDFDPQSEINVDIEMYDNEAAWNVKSLYELQYFFCPDKDCNYRHKSKHEIVDHIVENHAEYLILQKSITDDSLSDISNPIMNSTPKKKSTGRPSIPLLELSPQGKRDRLQEDYKKLQNIR